MVSGFDVRDNCLYTRTLEFHREGSSKVTLICTSHIGTSRYYENLQNIIDQIPYGLYEGMKYPEDEALEMICATLGYAAELDAKHAGLVHQSGRLKYDESSWMNSDVAAEELSANKLMAMIKTTSDSIKQQELFNRLSQRSPKKAAEYHRKEILWLLDTFLFEPSLLKEPSNTDEEYRNKLLFANLERLIRSHAFEEIGVVYGAMHFQDIEPLLEGIGYKPGTMDELRVFGLKDPIEVSSD